MSGLNWDVDPASIKTTPALSERALAHALAPVAKLNAWIDQLADMAAELKTWEIGSRKYETTMLTLGKLQGDLYELRREHELKQPVGSVSDRERALVLAAIEEYKRELEARLGAD